MRGYLFRGKMMIITERKVSEELLYYRALSRRTKLEPESQKLLNIYERGYEGERTYDKVYDDVLNHLYVFRGVYLKIGGGILQCDSLIVSDNGLIVHEIKNYNGNYKYENDQWFVRNFEISEDPLIQLKRTMTKLIKLKYTNNINFSIEGKVIFPNIDFFLSSTNENIWDFTIMRHQLKRHLSGFKDFSVTYSAEKLAEVIQDHIVENPYFDKVADFDRLKKGLYCRACGSYDVSKSKIQVKCKICSHKDTIHTITLFAIAELNNLFRDEPITRKRMWLLLNGQVSLATITRMLNKYCNAKKKGAAASYQFKYYDFDEAYFSEERLWRYKDSPIKVLS